MLAADLGQENVMVQLSELHSDGLFLKDAVQANEIVFQEHPLVAMQSLHNRHDIVVCSNCWRPLGNVSRQLVLLSRQVTRADFEDEVPLIPDDQYLADIVPCANRCGELYCSVECQELHYSRCHRLLCVGNIADEDAPTHPLIEFKMNAVQTNEIFLLVADIIAMITARLEQQGADSNIDEASAPFNPFVQNPWWEVANSPDGEKATVALREVLRNLVAESSGLLRRAIPASERFLTDERFARIVGMFEQNNVGIRLTSPASLYFKQLLGPEDETAEEACQSLVPIVAQIVEAIDNAACCDEEDEDEDEDEDDDDVGENDDAGNVESKGADGDESDGDSTGGTEEQGDLGARDYMRQLVEEHDNEDLSGFDVVFPPLDGTALYSLICKMNHSCNPSCAVDYTVHPERGLVAQVRALRAIAPGEELTQSYIDSTMPIQERQAALKDYGFQCRCPKCESEQS